MASAPSTPAIRAWACGLRTSPRWSMSGSARSSRKRPRPATSRPSSFRLSEAPTSTDLVPKGRGAEVPDSDTQPSQLRSERRLCRRNRFLGGGFGRGAKPPSEPQVLVAALLERGVRVAHQVGAGLAEHHLKVRGLEADIGESVDHVGRARYAVPRSQYGLRAVARAVLDEDLDLAAEDEEHLLDLVGMRGIALARRDEHHAEREVLGGNDARIRFARGAAPDEPVLRAPVALDARVRERIPIALAIGEAGHLPAEQLL